MASSNDQVSDLFDQGAQAADPDAYAKSVHQAEDAKAQAQEQVGKQTQDAVSDLFDSGVQEHQAANEPTQPEEPSTLDKAEDFAKNLPQSAIDLIPGMKQRREDIEAYRSTPDMQQKYPAPETGMEDPAYQAMTATGETPIWALAKLIPGLGSKLAEVAPKMETAASRLASEAVGMNPLKEIPKEFNPETGRSAKDYYAAKGIGTTALNEGALPFTGGMRAVADNAQNSININLGRLDDMLPDIQDQLDVNLPDYVNKVGNLGDKLGNNLVQFRENVPDVSNKNALLNKIDRTYLPRIQQIADSDGNLAALQQQKQKLYSDIKSLSADAYGPNANSAKQSEVTFLKGMANIVKGQIEGLAKQVDPAAADQISQINQNISNMIDFQSSAEKSIGKTSSLMDIPARVATGYTNQQLGTIAAARGMSNMAKVIKTPIGDIAQAVRPVPAVISPFAPQYLAKGNQDKSTTMAASLYNATDDSLTNVAQKMKQDPLVSHYGDALLDAIKSNDVVAKNNAIFVIMQNPNARKLLKPQGTY